MTFPSILNFYDALELVNASSDDLWIIICLSMTTKETLFLLNELISFNKNQIILVTSNDKSEILEKIYYVFKLKLPKYTEKCEILDSFNLNVNIVLVALMNLIITGITNKINNDKLKRFLEFNEKDNKWKNSKAKPKRY